MVESNTIYEVVRKLIGSITPCARHNTDIERLKNLEINCELVLDLIDDIYKVAMFRDSCAYSVSLLGKTAHDCLLACSEIVNGI